MKKLIIILLTLSIILPASAATNDFTADGNITVSAVTFGATTADMLIMNGSTAESWTFGSGTFTVTNPGTFMVGSSDTSVASIKITQGGTNVACAENSTPGTSYVTLPTTAAIYTVEPYTTTNCTSLCASVSNAATLNSFPTCGAATCNSGYTLSGSGASATCVAAGGGIPLNILQQMNQPTNQQTTTETPGQTTAESPASAPSTAGEPAKDAQGNVTLEQMVSDAATVASGDVNKVIAEMGVKRDVAVEANYSESIVAKIIGGLSAANKMRDAITNFVTYGTPATKILGAGERGGVVASFQAAFGKLPSSQADWNDVIKIANGRWPSQESKTAEDRAIINFKKVYLRDASQTNSHDDAAITVMAYGLRPASRNMNSERAAIKSFKAIYGYNPVKATAWDVVRAIAYSGAKR